MTPFELIRQNLMACTPVAKIALTRNRMSVSGKNILDENGNPWVARGFNYGHGELGTDQDAAIVKALGGNGVRIIPREWGTYSGTTVDSYDPTSPISGFVNIAYFAGVVKRVVQAKLQGLKVILAFDSNCGQTERVGDATCALGLGSPQTFWTTGGLTRLSYHENAIRTYARTLRGLVDFWEPVVEPNPTTTIPTGVIKTDVWTVQDTIRNIILSEDPAALFIIGGLSYTNNSLVNWYNSAWASQSNTIYTCDELSNAVTNGGGAGMPNDVLNLTGFRTAAVAPVCVQQFGDTITDDPDGSLLASAANLLSTAAGGSIGFWIWELVSTGSNSYGPMSGSPGSRAINQARMDLMQSILRAPATAAS